MIALRYSALRIRHRTRIHAVLVLRATARESFDGRTLESIGIMLGVTNERIRQIEESAIARFKRHWEFMELGIPFPALKVRKPTVRNRSESEKRANAKEAYCRWANTDRGKAARKASRLRCAERKRNELVSGELQQ